MSVAPRVIAAGGRAGRLAVTVRLGSADVVVDLAALVRMIPSVSSPESS